MKYRDFSPRREPEKPDFALGGGDYWAPGGDFDPRYSNYCNSKHGNGTGGCPLILENYCGALNGSGCMFGDILKRKHYRMASARLSPATESTYMGRF